MKRLLIALSSLLLSVVSGYSLYYFSLSAGAAVRRELSAICPENWTTKDFRLVGTQTQSQKTIAVYRVNCFDAGDYRKSFLGYETLERRGLGWRSLEPGSHLEVLPEFTQGYVEYGTVNHENQHDRLAMIYGEILGSEVTAIEVDFDTGESWRQETKDGVFAIASPEATKVLEIRVLSENGQILQQDSNRLPMVYDEDGFSVAPSPEDAIRHSYLSHWSPCSNREIRHEVQVLGDFRVLRTVQYSPDAQMVFFRLLCRTHGRAIESALIGIKTVQQEKVQQRDFWRDVTYFPLFIVDAPFSFAGEILDGRSVWSTQKSEDTRNKSHYTFYFGDAFGCGDSSVRAEAAANESYTFYTFYSGSTFQFRDLFAPAEATAVEVTFSTGETLRDEIVNGIFSVGLPKDAQVCHVKFLRS